RLVAQAHAQDGDLSRQLANDIERHPGVVRSPGAGRQQDSLGSGCLYVRGRGRVVQPNVTARPEGRHVLDEVVRKGVVVVDDDDGRLHVGPLTTTSIVTQPKP